VTRFVSGANLYKLTPGVRAAWMEILRRVPRATISLYPFGPAWSGDYDSTRLLQMLERDADRAGIAHSRIEIRAPFGSVPEMKQHLATCDVYLDSFPFSGVNSVLDPITCGVPVVSLRGASFRANMGASVLDDLGLSDLAAHDVGAYVDVAVRLGTDVDHRASVVARLRESLAAGRSRLWDSEWCSREFARLFDEMETLRPG
jgi:predicted O-linked N-acetylglucosamine transferase (SPINDLY family)